MAIPRGWQHWLRVGLATGPADRVAAESAIDRLYQAGGLARPIVKLWVSSPLEGLFSASVLARALDGPLSSLRTGPLLRAWRPPFREPRSVRGTVEVRSLPELTALRDSVRSAIQLAITARQSDSQSQHWTAACLSFCHLAAESDAPAMQRIAETGDRLWDAPAAPELQSVLAHCGFGQHDADALSRLSALPAAQDDPAVVALSDLAQCAGWWWAFDSVCVLAERPVRISRSTEPPSLEYPDGWSAVTRRAAPAEARRAIHA